MKLGITGSRSIENANLEPYLTLKNELFRAFCRENGLGRRKITHVISGGARGVDRTACETAERLGQKNVLCLPDRKRYPGRRIYQGYEARNREIVVKCDILLAVWDGRSAGTKRTIMMADEMGKPVFTVKIRKKAKRQPPEEK